MGEKGEGAALHPNDNEVGSILVAAADLAGLAQPKIEAGFFAELSELLEFRVNA